MALLPLEKDLPRQKHRFQQKPHVFPPAIEMHLSRGSDHPHVRDNLYFFALLSRVAVQAFTELQFFGDKKLITETSQFSEHFRLAKDE